LIPCVKPLLNQRQCQRCLAWAKDKKDWTVAQWAKVIFSDKIFCISFRNEGPRVWKKRGTESKLHEVHHHQDVLEHYMLPSADQLYEEMIISISNRTWHLPTLPNVLRSLVSMCFIGQQTHPT
ncbi:hypothetical protein C0J45_24463, partial [Silurus meridionalis]